ncbi:MAG: hypothetical protein IPP60_15370 [Sphingobacteriales bacterium]|nr:hypothetical protein [Sphingobacteriales bacterium]
MEEFQSRLENHCKRNSFNKDYKDTGYLFALKAAEPVIYPTNSQDTCCCGDECDVFSFPATQVED